MTTKITKEEFERTAPHYCGCLCNQLIPWQEHYGYRGIPKFLWGHNGTKTAIKITEEEFYRTGPHYCECEKHDEIYWQEHYKRRGIPKYTHGHNKSTLGRKHTKEECDKMSVSHIGKASGNKGKKMSPATCEKMSIAKTGSIPWNKGKTGIYSDKTREEMGVGRKGKPAWNKDKEMSDEYRRICSLRQIKYISNMTNVLKKNKLECEVENLLKLMYSDYYSYGGDGNQSIGGFFPDFISKDKTKIIEVFGDYWHDENRRNLTYPQTYGGRKRIFRNKGIEILIIWEHEIDKNYIYNKIMNFTGNINII